MRKWIGLLVVSVAMVFPLGCGPATENDPNPSAAPKELQENDDLMQKVGKDYQAKTKPHR